MLITKEILSSTLDSLEQEPILAVDCETTGLYFHDRLFSIQLAGSKREAYFDKRILRCSWHHVVNFFSRPRTWVLQNAKFDLRMFRHDGIELKSRIEDLEVLARLENNNHLTYSLASIVSRLGMEKLSDIKEWVKKNKGVGFTKRPLKWSGLEVEDWHLENAPLDLMVAYGCRDVRVTYDARNILLSRLDPVSSPVWENEVRLTPICFEMEWRGVKVDTAYAEKMIHYENGLVREALHQFRLVTGEEFNNSREQMMRVFTDAGENIPKTAKGNPSFTEDVLFSFKSPAAKAIQQIRYRQKRITTYYASFLDRVDENGILRPDMRQAGTATGRFSYRDPNLQNIPKEDSDEDMARPNLVRRCLVPREGHTFVSIDYSQQEYRLMLAYANEKKLIREVMDGADVHQAMADLLGLSRSYAKTVNFGCLYGSGEDKLSQMLGVSVREAQKILNNYFTRIPGVDRLITHIQMTARSRGHIYNWLGRKLMTGGRQFCYKMPNHLIQGGGADICKSAMVALGGEPMVLQIHDQLVLEVPTGDYDRISHWVKTMEDVFPEKNGMRMKADVEWSTKSMAVRDMVKGIPNEENHKVQSEFDL